MNSIYSFLASLLVMAATASAQTTTVPKFISYQGRVVDGAGASVGAGTPVNRTVIFRIWDHPSNVLTANLIYSESQVVTISNGEFSALVGQGVVNVTQTYNYAETTKKLADLVTAFSGSSRYLGVTVAAGGTVSAADREISPRQQIVATPFAMRAFVAEFAQSIMSSSDLTLNPLAGTSNDYGLGWYGSGRPFSSVAIDGPVLYGKAGGALGSNSSGVQKTALRWDATGRVGIGATSIDSTTNKLTLQGDMGTTPADQLAIRGNANNNERLLLGYDTTANRASLQSYTAATTPGSLLLNPSGGNVGIGEANPGFPLNFGSAYGDKISLWGTAGATYGFGIQNSLLQIHSDSTSTDVAIGSGSSASFTERMRVKGNGNVGIGNTNPSSALQVTGVIHAHDASVVADDKYNGLIRTTRPPTVSQHINMTRAGMAVWSIGYVPNSNTFGIGLANPIDSGFNPCFRIAQDGKAMINTTDSSATLNVGGVINIAGTRDNGTAARFQMYYDPVGAIVFNSNNTAQFSGSVRGFSYDGDSNIDFNSDRRLKENIVDAEPMLDRLMQLPFRRYNWKNTTGVNPIKEFGVIAQEVEPLFPDLVGKGEDGMLKVGYTSFATIACKSIQELNKKMEDKIAQLETELSEKEEADDAEITALKSSQIALETRLSALEKLIQTNN